jgi:hypothetical protein
MKTECQGFSNETGIFAYQFTLIDSVYYDLS